MTGGRSYSSLSLSCLIAKWRDSQQLDKVEKGAGVHLQTSTPSSSCRVTSGTEVEGLSGPFSARGEIICILVPSIFSKNLCMHCDRFWDPHELLGRAGGLLNLERGLLVNVKFNTNGSFPTPSSASAVHDHWIARHLGFTMLIPGA